MAENRLLVSHDIDFLAEATRRQRQGIDFLGIAYSHPNRITIGQLIFDLELIATAYELTDVKNQVIRLPL